MYYIAKLLAGTWSVNCNSLCFSHLAFQDITELGKERFSLTLYYTPLISSTSNPHPGAGNTQKFTRETWSHQAFMRTISVASRLGKRDVIFIVCFPWQFLE